MQHWLCTVLCDFSSALEADTLYAVEIKVRNADGWSAPNDIFVFSTARAIGYHAQTEETGA